MVEQDPTIATSPTTDERTMLEKVVVGLVALSAIGFVMSLIGHFAGWDGFDDGGESTAAGDTFWLLYFFAGIAALVAGAATLVHGIRGHIAGEKRAGQLALAYVVASIVIIAIVDSLLD